MGWWKVEGTQTVIGDVVLDTLGRAVREVVEAYNAAFHRYPTRAEWEALLLGVFGSEEPEARVIDDGVVNAVRLSSESEP